MAQKLLEEHPSQKIILSEVKSMKNLDLRKIEGKGKKVDTPVYIFVESSGDLTRSDARMKLTERLMKKRIFISAVVKYSISLINLIQKILK